MALLAGFTFLLLGRVLGRRRAVIPVLVVVAGYAIVVGGDAAVLRAALMGGLVVLAVGLQRRSTALVSLAVACWVMTLANPTALWDVGFQLSAAATVGLILVAPPIMASLRRVWPAMPEGVLTGAGAESDTGHIDLHKLFYSLVVESAVITVAANIMVMPLLAYHFRQVSLVGLLANLLITPVQPAIMAWGSVAVVLGTAGFGGLAKVVLWVPWLGFYWTVAVIERVAKLPGATMMIDEFGRLTVLVSYLVIFAVLWQRQWRGWLKRTYATMSGPLSSHSSRDQAPPRTLGWLCGALGVCTILVWWAVFTLPDGRLHIWFLDVGQGDGIFIETPSGRQILIDGGRSGQVLFSQLGAVMPFWDRSLDMMVLTHPDGDHMDGQIEAPSRFQIERAIDTAASQVNPEGALWRDSLAEAQVPVVVMGAGGWVDLGDSVALWALSPPMGGVGGDNSDNENSLVLKLVYGDFSVLMTGDAGLVSEEMLLRANAPLGATVLKVGHHGSAGSTSQAFVAAVNPAVAVIQVGVDNTYGHPDEEVLENLAGRRILRNDVHGRVHIYSDGADMWIEVEQRN